MRCVRFCETEMSTKSTPIHDNLTEKDFIPVPLQPLATIHTTIQVYIF